MRNQNNVTEFILFGITRYPEPQKIPPAVFLIMHLPPFGETSSLWKPWLGFRVWDHPCIFPYLLSLLDVAFSSIIAPKLIVDSRSKSTAISLEGTWPSSSLSTRLVEWASSSSPWWPVSIPWPSVSLFIMWASWDLRHAACCWEGPGWGIYPHHSTDPLHVSNTLLWSWYNRPLYMWFAPPVGTGLHGHPHPGSLRHPQRWGDVCGCLPHPHHLLSGHPLFPGVLQLQRAA